MVKKQSGGKELLIKIGISVLYVALCVLAMLIIPTFFPLVAVALGFGVFYIFSMLNVEYEYIFTNGDLDIDCIYNKNKRKHIFSGDIKVIEIMTHIDEKGYDADFAKATVKKDCSSGKYGLNTYKFLVNYKDKYHSIIFEPNDTMLQAMTPYLGQRRLIRKR